MDWLEGCLEIYKYTAYQGPRLANQNNRKLGVYLTGSQSCFIIDIFINEKKAMD